MAANESIYDIQQGDTYATGPATTSVTGGITNDFSYPPLINLYPGYGEAGAIPAINAGIDMGFANLNNVNVTVVNVADEIEVTGYIDMIVDPGTIKVKIQTGIPPLGISTYGGSPVVFFPTATGTNYTLQTTTNLLTGTWSTVTNGVPFTGIQITNATSPVFFRLH